MFYYKKVILSSLIIGFLLFTAIPYSLAQEIPAEAPETFEEVGSIGKQFLTGFPEALKQPWIEALTIWKKVLGWFKNLWASYIGSWFQNIWYKISYFLGKEVEQRKPEIQEEFEKEKQEMKEESLKAGKSLWQRFKDLIK